MKIVFLALDFLIPAFFFFLGRCGRGKVRRCLVSASLLIFLLVALFVPFAYPYFSLAAQGIGTAGILFCQCLFTYLALHQKVILL